ncbi:MAG TPA: NAD(P)-dependent oxidoreductase [Mycobacteriales bacterium]|nr:NAD(P)-dependent oxidoreductase [Mycobacteriales bacterium]
MRVAFLGLGRMGAAMAAHVLAAGHDLAVWNRTPGRAGELVQAGARQAASAADAVAGAEAVVLMLFGPDSVRDVLPTVVGAAPPGALVIDATTIGPTAAREFGATCAAGGLRYVDAPVTGSVAPAREGTLGVLVGGSTSDYEAALPLLHLWGDPARVRHIGGVGSASALKLVSNQGIGVIASGLGETLRLSTELGLDRAVVLDVLSTTAYGWAVNGKRAMLDASDFSATQFSLDLLEKDLALAVEAGPEVDLQVTRAALAQVRKALDAGHAGEDFAAVVGHLADEGEANSA